MEENLDNAWRKTWTMHGVKTAWLGTGGAGTRSGAGTRTRHAAKPDSGVHRLQYEGCWRLHLGNSRIEWLE